ncbi:MAG: DUF4249 family protein [Rhodothermales bacterium]
MRERLALSVSLIGFEILPMSLYRLVLLAGVIPLILGGCDTEVNPILGEGRPFSLYGYLNPTSPVQAVRVFPVASTLEEVIQDKLDAVVVSENLTTGERITWTDSLTTLPSGERRHVFYAPFSAEYEHTYRLTVTRSDGAQSSATVQVPPLITFSMVPPAVRQFELNVPLQLSTAPAFALSAYAEYKASTIPLATECSTPPPILHNVRVPYDVAESRQNAWRFLVKLEEDFKEVEHLFEINNILPDDRIFLHRIRFVVNVTNAEWEPPEGEFDLDTLAEPGVFSNVENGFGFLGAGYPAEVSWRPETALLETIGYYESRPLGACQS